MTLALLGIAILGLLLLRVPIGFAMLGPCLAYMILTGQSIGLSVRLAASTGERTPPTQVAIRRCGGVVKRD